jgi:AcrR family transcriptional regulator
MTSAVDKDSSRRVRDAAASRRGLLAAGGELFHARGYEGATVRDIGERAGVDPALIARYFGGKEGLYLAVLAEEQVEDEEPLDAQTFVAELLRHWDLHGHSPVSRALGALELSDDVREQVRAIVRERMLGRLALEGTDAALRAEILIALVLGISLTRANGTLPRLSRASRTRLLATLAPVVDALTPPLPRS